MDDFDRYLETSLARLLEPVVSGAKPPPRRPRGRRLGFQTQFLRSGESVPIAFTAVVPPAVDLMPSSPLVGPGHEARPAYIAE
jgi:hypothetical protein